ncbi:MAG: hypothetical protein WCC27_15610 [Acidobacteriaceae bacterium]
MRFLPLLPSCLLAAAASAVPAMAQVTVQQPNGPIVLEAGSATSEFTLHNGGKTDVPLSLNAGIVQDRASHAGLSSVKVTFKEEATGKDAPANLAAGKDLALVATIGGMSGTSVAEISVFNGADSAGKLQVIAADAPMNISVSGEGAAGTPLVLNNGGKAWVTLKNGDAQAYALRWHFRYRTLEKSGTVSLPASGTATIFLQPDPTIYSWSDSVYPSTQTGHLEVSLDAGDAAGKVTVPRRDLPVSLTMQRSTPTLTAIYSDLYVIGFLLVGGIISLAASSVLPNSLRRSAFRRQLIDLANRTSSVSTRVDSYLRVLLRLERKGIDVALQSTRSYFLSASASLDEISTDIDRLTTRLTVAERIDDLRRRLATCQATSPPTITEDVDAKLQAAADSMHNYALPDDNVKAANATLDAANNSLGTLNNSTDLAKQIAANFTDLQTRLKNFLPRYDDLQKALPGVFGILQEAFDNPKNITPRMVYAIDHNIAAINSALDYAAARQEVAAKVEKNPSDKTHYVWPDPTNPVIDAIKAHETELIELLSEMSWQSLREARLLVQEIHDNIYEQDVLDEVDQKTATVTFDTQKARPYLPISFYIDFRKWDLDRQPAAINRLAFVWDFPDKLQEKGAKVCHFFQGNEPAAPGTEKRHENRSPADVEFPNYIERWFRKYRRRPPFEVLVKVTVQSRKSQPQAAVGAGAAHAIPAVAPAAIAPGAKTLSNKIEIQPATSNRDRSRVLAETLRFAIAFGVALAGLLSGGVEELGKVGLIPATFAIIALGFGADAIKNLLTQPSTAAPAAAKSS